MPLCFACKKNQPVVTYERKTVDGIRVEHYCLACHEKRFLTVRTHEADSHASTACPYCGATADELKKTALVGCAHCYKSIAEAIPAVIRMQQGSKDAHRGKTSENLRPKARAERRCQELIALKEYYERTGESDLSARYERLAKELQSEIKRGDYDGA